MTTIQDPYARLERAEQLLTSALKWVRMIEERAEDVPQWFRHDADPKPLRKAIEEWLD